MQTVPHVSDRWAVPTLRARQAKRIRQELGVAGGAEVVFEAAVDLVVELLGRQVLHLLQELAHLIVVIHFFQVFS